MKVGDTSRNQAFLQGKLQAEMVRGGGALLSRPLIIVALVLLATVVRFWDLGAESFWYDEFIMMEVTNTLDNALYTIEQGRPPLQVIVGYLWTRIFGHTEIGVRSLSAILGVASILLIYVIAEHIFDQRVALIASGLASISGFLVYHSQDYRYYSLFVFITLVSYYFFIKALWTGKRWYFIPYALASILVYYTHLFGLFVFMGQGVFFLLRWGRYKDSRVAWFLSQVAIVIMIMPHLWPNTLVSFVSVDDGETVSLGPSFLATRPNNTPLHTIIKYIAFNFDYLQVLPIVLASLILVGGTVFFIARRRQEWLKGFSLSRSAITNLFTRQTDATLLALTWFIFPMFVPFLLGQVMGMGPLYLHRYVIPSAPGFFLLLALGLVSFRHLIPLYASLGALITFMGIGLTIYYNEPTKEEWREAIAYIARNESPDDVIILTTEFYNPRVISRFHSAFDTYYVGNLARCELFEDFFEDADANIKLRECIGEHARLWLVIRQFSTDDARVEGLNTFINELLGMELASQRVYYGVQLLQYTWDEEIAQSN